MYQYICFDQATKWYLIIYYVFQLRYGEQNKSLLIVFKINYSIIIICARLNSYLIVFYDNYFHD